MQRPTTLLVALVTHWAASCAEPNPHCPEFATAESAVKLTTPEAGVYPLPASGALFSLRTRGVALDQLAAEHLCTATRLSANTFLSARHCTSHHEAYTLELTSTPRPHDSRQGCAQSAMNASVPDGLFHVERLLTHETLDLVLLFTSAPPGSASQDELMTLTTSAPKTGSRLYLAGSGLTEQNTLGELRALEATVIAVSHDTVIVQGIGGAACVGDSGGPLFSTDGPPTLFGVLSTGSASCLGKDYYVNVLAASEWVEAHVDR
jgi:hypothetical protein